jgi:tetratricopeptide (TPR) repeat protein
VRWPFAVLLFVAAASVFAQDAKTPEVLLERGVGAYRAGDSAGAIAQLDAALQAFLTPARTQTYVSTGRLDALPSIETALVYLALAQFRLNREDDARDTLLRLHAAERIAPTYAMLPLAAADATEIEALSVALLTAQPLPRNGVLPSDDAAAPLPPIVPRLEAEQQAERHARIDALIGDLPRATPAPAAVTAAPAPRVATTAASREQFTALREADIAAENGAIDQAVRLYTSAVAAPGTPREVLAAAATGLYRVAAFRDAVQGFRRLGTFAKGEEDLRYYYAVSLYESGDYAQAQKEMACALPFIVVTDEVLRYRNKIELTLASK